MTRYVHWLAQLRGLLEFADKIFHRPDKHPEPLARGEGERKWTLSFGNLWPVTHEAPSRPSCSTFTTLRRMTHQGRADNNFERGRPSRAGVADTFGYSPGSVGLSEEVRSTARPPVALCQPTESASISLSDKDIEMFTGVLVVRKAAAGGGMILEGDPAEWIARAYDKLRDRRISPDRLVLALSTRLSPTVRHPFRWHFGPILERCGQALVETKFPFTAPLAERVVFEAVSFEVFWPWMPVRCLRLAHPNVAGSRWQAMEDRTSTLATLAEDSCEFTRLLPRSDLMDAVLRGDEAAMRYPVLNDTVELARSL